MDQSFFETFSLAHPTLLTSLVILFLSLLDDPPSSSQSQDCHSSVLHLNSSAKPIFKHGVILCTSSYHVCIDKSQILNLQPCASVASMKLPLNQSKFMS